MAYKEDADNLLKNTCAICKRYVEEPSNAIMDDVRAEMRNYVETKQNEFAIDITANGVSSSADLKRISDMLLAFEKELYFKCSSEYSEADHHIVCAFMVPAGDLGETIKHVDLTIYSLLKADKHPRGKLLTKANWREVVSNFCFERFVKNKSLIIMNSKTIASMGDQEKWIPGVIQEWLQVWESQYGTSVLKYLA